MRLRIGTRRSALARAQTTLVCDALRSAHLDVELEVVALETTGDRVTDRALRESGGKGLFVKELDEALLDGRIDCAVHSLKDVPTELAPGVVLASVPERLDARDALLSIAGTALEGLPEAARVGTSSPRRAAQLLARRPDLRVDLLRGNVETRLRRLLAGDFDATLLAMAGLDRLAIDTKPAVAVALDPHDFVPSPGQGSLCLVARDGERSTIDLLRAIEHPASRSACDAERSAARVLGGSCYLPVGAYAEVDGDRLYVVAVLTSPDGRKSVRRQAHGACVDAERIGASAGTEVLAGGGADVVASLERA